MLFASHCDLHADGRCVHAQLSVLRGRARQGAPARRRRAAPNRRGGSEARLAACGCHLGRSRRPARRRRRAFRRYCSCDQIESRRPRGSRCWCPTSRASFASVETVVESPIDIYNHNIETVPSLYRSVRPGGNYERSLDVIRHAKDAARRLGKPMFTKAGVMLGLGETNDQLLDVIRDLRRRRVRHPDAGAVSAAVGRSHSGGALRAASGIRGDQDRRACDGIPSRRVRAAGAELVPRVGARLTPAPKKSAPRKLLSLAR